MGSMRNQYLYDVATEAELSEVLSHYSTEYVIYVLKNCMEARFNPTSIMSPQPNLVSAWESNFKSMNDYYAYPELRNTINTVREATYNEIIKAICEEFHLNFTIDNEFDCYSAAFFLYDFFVSNFNQYLIQFISKYIYKERNSIYESMGLANTRKSKDTSTAYGKRLYKDIKVITINANIDRVISNICENSIDLSTIISSVYPRDKAIYLLQLVSPQDDFFRNFYATILNSNIKAILLTEIRFALQALIPVNENLPMTQE